MRRAEVIDGLERNWREKKRLIGRGKRAPLWSVQSRFRVIHYWASEASPTLGCSIEISRDICCRYVVGMSVVPYFLDWNAHSNTTRPRIQDYQGLLPNLIERALVYSAHLLITDDLYQCLWCCNSFLSKMNLTLVC